MRGIDKRVIKEFGISAILLMENTEYKVSCVALNMLSGEKTKKVVCICGKGNNSGDGFVYARYLINNGIDTNIVLVGKPLQLKGE